MRRSVSFVVCALLFSGLALGQGAGGQGQKKTIAQQIRESSSAGPGYIQNDFLGDLKGNLKDKFGEKRGTEMWDQFQKQELDEKDVLDLMNGKSTTSSLEDYFGATRGELGGLEEILDGTVEEKDKKIYFGIMIFVMVIDFDMDPSSEFCQQAAGSREELDSEQFDKLTKGNVSKKTIEDSFGFEDKEDLKFMQEILNRIWECLMTAHPMAQSLGMSDSSQFSRDNFPTFGEGMPGFGQFGDGTAGGFPFDSGMPPCPFCGGNMDSFFGEGAGGMGGMPGMPGGGSSDPNAGAQPKDGKKK